jgi:hypothetical protein
VEREIYEIMTQMLYGLRLGKEGKIRLGCSAVIFDETRTKALLTRRADNDLWAFRAARWSLASLK